MAEIAALTESKDKLVAELMAEADEIKSGCKSEIRTCKQANEELETEL
jgi:hypothetical protein